MKNRILSIVSVFLPSIFIVITAIILGSHNTRNIKNNSENKSITQNTEKIEVLEKFFEKYNSPLKGHASTFVETADKYNIDYKLLPAISCMESTCGKRMIPNTYNPFGWGIYGDNYISFKSFDEAIKTVGDGLNKGYFSKGLNTVAKIAPVYTPPNSYNWRNGVTFFMNDMEKIEKEHKKEQEMEAIKKVVLNYL